MKTTRALGVAAIVSIAVVFLFLTSAAAPAMSSSQQANAFTSQANLLPNPELNTNITWSTYNSQWAPLEYSNGTGNQNLTASLSTKYPNPISINPADIESTAYQGKIKGIGEWDNVTAWQPALTQNSGDNDATSLKSWQTETNTSGYLKLTTNSSSTSGDVIGAHIGIPISDMPSSNGQYDYINMIWGATGTPVTGLYLNNMIENNTKGNGFITQPITVTAPETIYQSVSLAKLKQSPNSSVTTIWIGIGLSIPQVTTTSDYTLNLYGLSITSNPLYIGTAITNGSTKTVTEANGTAHLSQLNPAVPMKIVNGGYTVAVSQPLQNLTTQQNEITANPKYVEQVTYEGNYYLPSAPDLSYSSAEISEKFNVSTSQTTVLDINGLSLLNTIAGKNGTITLTTVNPTQKSTLIQIVDYTSSQWTAVSGPPGFFSVNGILYYFDEIVLGIIAVVGLGGGAAVARTRSLRRVK